MKGALKVSKEQVIEIERYCDEHGITWKQRIDELGVSCTAYYYTRGLLSKGTSQWSVHSDNVCFRSDADSLNACWEAKA